MIKYVMSLSIAAVLFSGCSLLNKNEKELEIVPADFVIEQDASDAVFELSELTRYDHQVMFQRRKSTLTEIEKAKLLDWLQVEQPAMIGVRGTGGSKKYIELGYKRASEIIDYLQLQRAGVDVILLDYDAKLPGGQGLITVIPQTLVSKIRTSAPILIISSN